MAVALDHLGGQVVGRAAVGRAVGVGPLEVGPGEERLPAEVCHFEDVSFEEQEVLGLDVSVDDGRGAGVQVGDCAGCFEDVLGCGLFGEARVLLEDRVELVVAQLHDQVDEVGVFEVGHQADHVRVFDHLHDLYLGLQLLDHLQLLDLRLRYELYRVGVPRDPVDHLADLPERPTAQVRLFLEVLRGQVAFLRGQRVVRRGQQRFEVHSIED